MTDIESRLHHAIGLAQLLASEPDLFQSFHAEGLASALRDAVEEIRELRADRERLKMRLEVVAYGDWADMKAVRDFAIDAARAQAEGGQDG